MLSKIVSFTSRITNKNTINSWFSIPKFSTSKSTPLIIDMEKFNNEGYYTVYESAETNRFRLIGLGLIYFGLFYAYQHYQSGETILNSVDAKISILSFLVLLGFEYKLRHTAKNIWLYTDGLSIQVNMFKWMGWSMNKIYLNTTDFGGFKPAIHKIIRMPTATYISPDGKKMVVFFKPQYSRDNEVLKKIFIGETFKVVEKDMAVNLSKKTKSKYGI